MDSGEHACMDGLRLAGRRLWMGLELLGVDQILVQPLVSQQFAACILLPDTKASLSAVSVLPKAKSVSVEPISEEDWEVLELNLELADEAILKQGAMYCTNSVAANNIGNSMQTICRSDADMRWVTNCCRAGGEEKITARRLAGGDAQVLGLRSWRGVWPEEITERCRLGSWPE
ncbi:hypothetical protein ACQ4PT_058231 [Festuca glaucescens]